MHTHKKKWVATINTDFKNANEIYNVLFFLPTKLAKEKDNAQYCWIYGKTALLNSFDNKHKLIRLFWKVRYQEV